MSSTIAATVFITSLPGKRLDLQGEIQRLIAHTVQEPGCMHFHVFSTNDEQDTFILWEMFADAQALQTHLDAEYSQRYFNCGYIQETKVIHHNML